MRSCLGQCLLLHIGHAANETELVSVHETEPRMALCVLASAVLCTSAVDDATAFQACNVYCETIRVDSSSCKLTACIDVMQGAQDLSLSFSLEEGSTS